MRAVGLPFLGEGRLAYRGGIHHYCPRVWLEFTCGEIIMNGVYPQQSTKKHNNLQCRIWVPCLTLISRQVLGQCGLMNVNLVPSSPASPCVVGWILVVAARSNDWVGPLVAERSNDCNLLYKKHDTCCGIRCEVIGSLAVHLCVYLSLSKPESLFARSHDHYYVFLLVFKM